MAAEQIGAGAVWQSGCPLPPPPPTGAAAQLAGGGRGGSFGLLHFVSICQQRRSRTKHDQADPRMSLNEASRDAQDHKAECLFRPGKGSP